MGPACLRFRSLPRRLEIWRSNRSTTWSRAVFTSLPAPWALKTARSESQVTSTLWLPSILGLRSSMISTSRRRTRGSSRPIFESLCSAALRTCSVIRTPRPLRITSTLAPSFPKVTDQRTLRRCGAPAWLTWSLAPHSPAERFAAEKAA